jgi:hypothetical protein
MSPTKIPTKAIDKGKYRLYPSTSSGHRFNKAQDFYRGMRRALDEGNWNSAGLEAVHCAISATDALLAYADGIRLATCPLASAGEKTAEAQRGWM